MFNISKETLEHLRTEYPAGARVELVHMNAIQHKAVSGCERDGRFGR